MRENISKKISKTLNSKNSQKLFDHIKQSGTDGLKTAWENKFKKKQQKKLIIS